MSGVPARHRISTAGLRVALLLALASLALFAAPGRSYAAGNTITSPDSGGQWTSIALDGAGFPVVSHYDPSSGDLKVVHCGSVDCATGNTLASPDTTNNVGQYSSLELDASGRPVVSYFDATLFNLNVLHCGNATCTSGNTIKSPAASMADSTGLYTSLELDASGNPVISYYTIPFDVLELVHCSDSACNAWSADFADPGNILGSYSSLVLDASGSPVISYFDETHGDLKVVHCGNANCTSGNTIVSPDTTGEVGQYTSSALDASGRPVVSYYGMTLGDLKVLHCGDVNCASGNSITSPDVTNDTGKYTSLVLDATGNPVVSSYSVTGGNLRVLHCGDPNCAVGNTAFAVDSTGDVGAYTSLALDAQGHPVVSYYDATNSMLKVLHCSDASCAGTKTVGGFTQLPGVADQRGGGSVTWWLMAGFAIAIAMAAGAGLAWQRRAD